MERNFILPGRRRTSREISRTSCASLGAAMIGPCGPRRGMSLGPFPKISLGTNFHRLASGRNVVFREAGLEPSSVPFKDRGRIGEPLRLPQAYKRSGGDGGCRPREALLARVKS